MRSILAKILLWSLVTFGLSLLANFGIFKALERHGPRENDPFWRMSMMIENDVRRAYEEGGVE
ncbi:MAG: hypothetical protein ACP5XB_11500, partial [Isosphaeraceae bacterium]